MVEAKIAYIQYTTELERAETEGATFLDCFRGTNARRTEIVSCDFSLSLCETFADHFIRTVSSGLRRSCAATPFSAFQSSSWSPPASVQRKHLMSTSPCRRATSSVALSVCCSSHTLVCLPSNPLRRSGLSADSSAHGSVGRATIYMGGLSVMFVLLITIGGLGFSDGDSQKTAVAVLFVISTLVNMISVGPVCYPIVAETPNGRLRYKTVVIGRFTYNLTGIFTNSVTPRMVSPLGSSYTL